VAQIVFIIGVFYFFVQFFGRLSYRQWWGAFFAAIRLVICLALAWPAFIMGLSGV
jgi:hypothetical protein